MRRQKRRTKGQPAKGTEPVWNRPQGYLLILATSLGVGLPLTIAMALASGWTWPGTAAAGIPLLTCILTSGLIWAAGRILVR
jgi:hypothetical protein